MAPTSAAPSSDRMHDRRTGEVQESELGIQEPASPLPGCLHGIDHAGQQGREQEEWPQLDAFGKRTGDNRRRGGAEHELEEKVRSRGRVGQVVRAVGPDAHGFEDGEPERAEVTSGLVGSERPVSERVHEIVTDQPVHDRGDGKQAEILGQLRRDIP